MISDGPLQSNSSARRVVIVCAVINARLIDDCADAIRRSDGRATARRLGVRFASEFHEAVNLFAAEGGGRLDVMTNGRGCGARTRIRHRKVQSLIAPRSRRRWPPISGPSGM